MLPARPLLRLLAAFAGMLLVRGPVPPARAAEGDAPPGMDSEAIFGREPRRPNPPQPIFYPPTPPPLDWPIFRTVSLAGRYPAPPELSEYVNEVFYPPLGTRLATDTLQKAQRQKLEQYRAAKLALQRELRAAVDAQAAAEPEARRVALEAFARQQTPRIAALEKTAEELRRDLITATTTWSARRDWYLSDKERRGFSPAEIATVMRGYAYYSGGLAPEQRRLLREIVLELVAAVDNVAAASQQPFVYFSPEPARVVFPDDLPPELRAKIASYQAKKSQLKKALYDTVSGYDGAVLGFLHHSLRGLAEKQAPAYRELETLAEEIRRGLAARPAPPPPADANPLPPTLALRVADVVRAKAVARRDAVTRAEAILARGRPVGAQFRIVYRFGEDGMNVSRLPARNRRDEEAPEEAEFLNRLQHEIEAVAATYGRKLADIINEQEAIRAEAAAFLGDNRRDKVEAALIAASARAILKENEQAYRDYRTAVFEPGLSPEQRRLLFDRAVETLDLPLPRGEPQPRSRPQSW